MTVPDEAAVDPPHTIAGLKRQLDEARAQQAAATEVLQVINSSSGNLAPVFDAMLERATRLCEAAFGVLWIYDGRHFHAEALHHVPPAFAEFVRAPMPPAPGGAFERLIGGEPVSQVLDTGNSEIYRAGTSPLRRAFVDLAGAQTVLFVALRKDDSLLGALTIYRQEACAFSQKQIGLVANFAAQAVIAMENARLLAELRERTGDLEESLKYQTATSNVLKVISQSGAELGSVLDTLVETAAQICRADSGFIFRLRDGLCRMIAAFGKLAEYRDFQARKPAAKPVDWRIATRPAHVRGRPNRQEECSRIHSWWFALKWAVSCVA